MRDRARSVVRIVIPLVLLAMIALAGQAGQRWVP
jgi:hypothetical protein